MQEIAHYRNTRPQLVVRQQSNVAIHDPLSSRLAWIFADEPERFQFSFPL